MCLRRLRQDAGDGSRLPVSTFRDWCVDNGVLRELAEAALAQKAGWVERAYHRSDA